eukprot:gene7259-9896_t
MSNSILNSITINDDSNKGIILNKPMVSQHFSHFITQPSIANRSSYTILNTVNAANLKSEAMDVDSSNNSGRLSDQNQIMTNPETALQANRRKMLRRAANRRSAQLSRARKKAHLEDLKEENARLQRLVNVLDSQPELIFCVTALGKITHLSERTHNFIKINLSEDENEYEPSHLNQILTSESAESVLESINHLVKHSLGEPSDEINMMFASKKVYFNDAFGHPLVGYLRCSKVVRHTALHEYQSNLENAIQFAENSSYTSELKNSNGSLPPSKKVKKNNGSLNSGSESAFDTSMKQEKVSTSTLSNSGHNTGSTSDGSNGKTPLPSENVDNEMSRTYSSNDWNLANFKILTDCVSSLAEASILNSQTSNGTNQSKSVKSSSSGNNDVQNLKNNSNSVELSKSNVNNNNMSNMMSVVSIKNSHNSNNNNASNSMESSSQYDLSSYQMVNSSQIIQEDDEFVCVIRTTDSCFVPHSASNRQLLMFSSLLSTASMVAHDRESGGNTQEHQRQGSPNGGSGGSTDNSSGPQPNSDSSKENKTSTGSGSGSGSETCSEEGNNVDGER